VCGSPLFLNNKNMPIISIDLSEERKEINCEICLEPLVYVPEAKVYVCLTCLSEYDEEEFN
jgi:hypothetical protein